MATYRNIQTSFWTDTKVLESFSAEDKYFYLYLMTNPAANLCGCYEISPKKASMETSYTVDAINVLLKRFEEDYKIIHYSAETREVLILNWHKYNWVGSSKVIRGAYLETLKVKTPEFKAYLLYMLKEHGYEVDEKILSAISYPYPNVTPCKNTFSLVYGLNNINDEHSITENIDNNVEHITNNSTSTKKSNSDNEADEEVVKEVIDYLNARVGANYRPNTAETIKLIHGRLSEGRTIEDFKYVIDVKADEWIGTSQEQYLRPKTLFAQSNFENYLQQRRGVKKKNKRTGKEPIDWDELTEWARKKDQEALEGDIVYDQ